MSSRFDNMRHSHENLTKSYSDVKQLILMKIKFLLFKWINDGIAYLFWIGLQSSDAELSILLFIPTSACSLLI